MTEADIRDIFDNDRPSGVDFEPAGNWARKAAALLAGITDDGRRADLRELFEERCAICEDGGVRSSVAERVAYLELAAATEGGER